MGEISLEPLRERVLELLQWDGPSTVSQIAVQLNSTPTRVRAAVVVLLDEDLVRSIGDKERMVAVNNG